jgi:hypothetical protein
MFKLDALCLIRTVEINGIKRQFFTMTENRSRFSGARRSPAQVVFLNLSISIIVIGNVEGLIVSLQKRFLVQKYDPTGLESVLMGAGT